MSEGGHPSAALHTSELFHLASLSRLHPCLKRLSSLPYVQHMPISLTGEKAMWRGCPPRMQYSSIFLELMHNSISMPQVVKLCNFAGALYADDPQAVIALDC